MKRLVLGAAVLLLAPARLHAQAAEQLSQAIRRYENLEIDRARTIFEQLLSPSSPFPVTEAQRVIAYKYLGATLATLGREDSAITYFTAALGRDPLVDLEARSFSEQERQVFQRARQRIFRVGLRPVPRDTLDPRTEHINITVATTHAGTVRLELVSTFDDSRYPLFDGSVEGPRDIAFNGLNPRGGGFIPQGAYDLVVIGESATRLQAQDSTSALIQIEWERAPMIDTLATLGRADTLPTRQISSAATRDLILGGIIAAGSLLSSKVIGQSDLQGRGALSASVAVVGVTGGVVAYLQRRNHPDIPENIAENAARQQRRSAINARIMAENGTRIDATKIIIRPLAQ
jgi:tetratricopeptide (TPR) repeat protein